MKITIEIEEADLPRFMQAVRGAVSRLNEMDQPAPPQRVLVDALGAVLNAVNDWAALTDVEHAAQVKIRDIVTTALRGAP